MIDDDDASHRGTWVQTERAAHEDWAVLTRDHPAAAQLLHILVARMKGQNRFVISQKQLAQIMGKSRDTVKRAVAVLKDQRWIDTYQIGERGTVNAYIVNDQVAWHGARDGRRHSLFTATVYVGEDEQPESLSDRALRRIPALYPDERQLPTGDGLPPISQPSLPSLEPDLPAQRLSREQPREVRQMLFDDLPEDDA